MSGKIRYQFLFFIINTTLYGLDKAFTLHCPFNSQWKLKARGKCNISDIYQCLYDVNSLKNIEACTDRPHFEAPGYKIQIVGSLEGVQCASDRYQPFIFWTNGSSICKFEKSTCADEGQIPFSLGTTKADSTCRCDYTKGYDFVVRPRNMCFCLPSEEDCSCVIRHCPNGFVLSPDYKCASVEELLTNTRCPIQTINGKDPEIQIILTKGLDDTHDTHGIHDVPFLKVVDSVLILLAIGICVVYIIIVSFNQSNIDKDEQKIRTEISIDEHTNEIKSLKGSLIKFEPTKVTDDILVAITKNPCVLIIGPFGSGKTINAYYIISKLGEEGYKTKFVSDPEQIERHFNRYQRQVFLMDDILGKYSLNISDIIDKLEKYRSAINSISKKSDTVKVIITCRTYIYQLYEQYFESYIPKTCFNLRLNLKERRNIYKAYFGSDPPELISNDILLLHHFYPLLCSSDNRICELEYFKYPTKIVSAEISNMQRRSDIGYLALAILVVLNNRVENKMLSDIPNSAKTDNIIFQDIFNESCFNQYPAKSMLQMTFKSLKGEFFKDDDTIISFLCPELFDVVALSIGGSFMQSILSHSSSVFIKEKLQLSSTQENNCPHTIKVQHDMADQFYRRLVSDLNNNFIVDVFSNRIFHSMKNRETFVVYIRKHVKVQMLQDKANGSNVLHIASFLGYSDFISIFLHFNDCPDINHRNSLGETPLHVACKKGHLRIVECLITRKAEVNKKDNNKRTALSFGCELGYLDIVKYLISNNALVNEKDIKGLTPLHIACSNGHYDVIKYLVEQKANINETDKIGRTPLHYACTHAISDIAEILILNKARVNSSDRQGSTPLHIACECGNEAVITLLMNHAVVKTIKNKQGQRPVDIAFPRKSVAISNVVNMTNEQKL